MTGHVETESDFCSPELRAYELAEASLVEYDRVRKETAKSFGIRVETLDKLVSDFRKEIEAENDGKGLSFDTIESWDEPVAPSEILDELVTVFTDFTKLPEHAPETIALWIFHTHVFEQANASPILALTSPEKRCGKTTTLSLVSALVNDGLAASNISPAALFRIIDAHRPTLLIDEADTFLADNDELRGVINSGHTPNSAFVIRVVGDAHEPQRFSTWAPKCIAMIGKLPATIADRAILAPLRRKRPGETIKRQREHSYLFTILKSKLQRCAEDTAFAIGAKCPAMPNELNDRAQDSWEPLMQIAEVAGEEWKARAHEAALALSGESDDESANVVLLRDIKQVFDDRAVQRIHSSVLVEALNEMDEAPWGEWNRGKPMTNKQLSARLRDFHIVSKSVRTGDGNKKGFEREQFSEAFERYIPPAPGTLSPFRSSHRHNVGAATVSGGSEIVTNNPEKTQIGTPNPAPDKGCADVTISNAENALRGRSCEELDAAINAALGE